MLSNPPIIGRGTKNDAFFGTIYASGLVLDFRSRRRTCSSPTMYMLLSPPTSLDASNLSYNVGYCYARNQTDSIDVRVTSAEDRGVRLFRNKWTLRQCAER